MRHWISKRRIGKDKEGRLEIHQYENYWGALFIICGGNSQADSITFESYNNDTYLKLLSIKVDDKWGYKDPNDSIVITPQYDYAQIFENGIAKVLLNEKWGYIDTLNQIEIPIIYDLIIPSKSGLLRVIKDSKWGIIDFKNNIIAPFEYNKIDDFDNNISDNSIFKTLAKAYKNNKVGFINIEGKEVIPVEYDEIDSYSDAKTYRTMKDGKYGYVTGNGVFCNPIFDEAEGFGYGRKNISDKIGLYAKVKYKGKSYILDQNGMLYTYKHILGEIRSADSDNSIKVSK